METCLILGELHMGTDALLSAILSGVLRPSAQPSEFGHAAVTVADIEEVRSNVPTYAVCSSLPMGVLSLFFFFL